MLDPKLNIDGTLDLGAGDEPSALTAADVDKLMEHLARLRSQMPEKIPETPPSIQGVVFNPLYMVRTDNQSKASLLRIRHTGYGWLNFELPSHEVINMKKMWKAIADKLDLDPYPDFYESERQQAEKPH